MNLIRVITLPLLVVAYHVSLADSISELYLDKSDLYITDSYGKKLRNPQIISLHLGNLSSRDMIELKRRGGSESDYTAEELEKIRSSEEFGEKVKIRVTVSSVEVFEGDVQSDPYIGYAKIITFYSDNRFLFIEIEFVDEDYRYTGVVDLKQGKFLGYERISYREGIRQSKSGKDFMIE